MPELSSCMLIADLIVFIILIWLVLVVGWWLVGYLVKTGSPLKSRST